MSAARRALAGALALALVAAVSACGVTRDGNARVIDPADVPFKLADSTTTTTAVPSTTTSVEATTTTAEPATTTTVPTEQVQLFFVQGNHIAGELRTVPVSNGSRLNAEQVLDQLLTVPASIPGASTLVQPGVLGGFLGVGGGTMSLSLGEAYFGLTPAQQVLALGQIVLTATYLNGVGRVQFRYANQNAFIWRGDTSTTDGEVSADDYRVLLGP